MSTCLLPDTPMGKKNTFYPPPPAIKTGSFGTGGRPFRKRHPGRLVRRERRGGVQVCFPELPKLSKKSYDFFSVTSRFLICRAEKRACWYPGMVVVAAVPRPVPIPITCRFITTQYPYLAESEVNNIQFLQNPGSSRTRGSLLGINMFP